MNDSDFQVTVIIVTWNSARHIGRCLGSIEKQSVRPFDVIVVDNGSTDETLRIVEAQRGLNLKVQGLKVNTGFAAANNLGVRMARGEWVALLNADAFPAEDWIEQLRAAQRAHPDVSCFASRLIMAERTDVLDGEGDAYHPSGLAWRQNHGEPVASAPRVQGDSFSACAAAALFERQAFLAVGGFDEDYFAYFEDVDVGFRLRLQGRECLYVPEAVVHHVGSASTGRRSDLAVHYGTRNLIWTYWKDMPAPQVWLWLPVHICMVAALLAMHTGRGQAKPAFAAVWAALRGLPAILGKRKIVQAQVEVPPQTVFARMAHGLGPLRRALRIRNRLPA